MINLFPLPSVPLVTGPVLDGVEEEVEEEIYCHTCQALRSPAEVHH